MPLDARRRAELARKGAVETTVGELFGIDEVGMQVVERRVRIAKEVRRRRLAARRINITQPRGPEIEGGASTRLDAVVLAFFAAGGDLAELAGVITNGSKTKLAIP